MFLIRKQIREGEYNFMAKQRKNVYWGAFVLDTFDLFLKDDLSRNEYEIFFFLCKKMDTNTNKVFVRQKDILNALRDDHNISKAKGTISKAIKGLLEKQYIAKQVNGVGYMINPSMFYTGGKLDVSGKIQSFNDNLSKQGISPMYELDSDSGKIESYD